MPSSSLTARERKRRGKKGRKKKNSQNQHYHPNNGRRRREEGRGERVKPIFFRKRARNAGRGGKEPIQEGEIKGEGKSPSNFSHVLACQMPAEGVKRKKAISSQPFLGSTRGEGEGTGRERKEKMGNGAAFIIISDRRPS